MRFTAIPFLVLALAAPVLAQPGPGLFGDRHWRKPVQAMEDLPVTASWGTVHLVAGVFYWWDGDSWELAGGGEAVTGPPGTPGQAGPTGAAATISVGTVSTGAPGSSASVTNSGTSSAAVFDFTIPRGDVGPAGADGAPGATGPAGADGAPGAQGPAGADGIPRIVQDEGIDLAQRLKINFTGSAVTCVDNSGAASTDCTINAGSGTIGGTVGSTADAIPVANGTGGSTLKASTVTISSGAVQIPDGSASAVGLRFGSQAAGTGFYGNGATTITYAYGGVGRFSISNATISTQNGSNYRNAGAGEAVFAPGNSDADSGLGANSSDDMAMYAAGFVVERWLRVAAGVYRSLNVGQAAESAQSVTCTSTGDGLPGALTINPTTALVLITNSDPDGCGITAGETNVATGVRVSLIVAANAGGSVVFSDTAGITELAGGFSAGVNDALNLMYVTDRWVETGRSDN